MQQWEKHSFDFYSQKWGTTNRLKDIIELLNYQERREGRKKIIIVGYEINTNKMKCQRKYKYKDKENQSHRH